MTKDEALHRYDELQKIFDEFIAAHEVELREKGKLIKENELLKATLDKNNIYYPQKRETF